MFAQIAGIFAKPKPADIEISALYTELKKLENGLVDPKRKTSLTRYFVICSTAIMLPVLAACGYLQWSGSYEKLLSVEKQHNVRLAKILSESLWHRHSSYLMGAEDFSGKELRASPETTRIHENLKVLAEGLGVLKVQVHSTSGKTIYSSSFDQIGKSKWRDTAFEKAVAGREAISRTFFKNRFEGFSPSDNVNVVQTFVPIIDSAGQVISVIEIYTDITHRLIQAKLHSLYVFVAYLASLLLLVATIIFFMKRADRILQAQSQKLSANYERLRANEEELTRAHGELKTANRDLSKNIAALEQAQHEIIEKGKLAQLGQLTATVAHEIRNPLGSVRTAAYLLQRKIDVEQLGVSKQFKRIEDGVKRCDSIISQLLSFARRDTLNLQSTDVNAWIRSVVATERESVPGIVTLQENYDPDIREIQIDPDQLQRVIVNLISNASEAMVGRDGTEVSTEAPVIVISTALNDGNIEIAVKDNGPGITPENLEKIRQPLFTTKSFGVGLGIPAVEKILQFHGGGLRIETEVDHGTAMIAWFPCNEDSRTGVAQ
ncbi:MAG: sensor histidine kinase [Hyphomicrobiaceae bacterium]